MVNLKRKKSVKDDIPTKEQKRKDSSVKKASRARSRSASVKRTKSFTPTERARADSLVSIPHSHSTSLASSQNTPIDIAPSSQGQEHSELETRTSAATNERDVSNLSDGNHHSHNDSNGILSSIFNVAHNAANMIGSSIDNKPPKTHESTIDEGDEKSTSFSHKLDFLLKPATFGKNTSSPSITKSKSSKSDSQTDLDYPRYSEELPSHTTNSLSNVHFQAVRESPIATLGTGDLKLDDFDEALTAKKETGPTQPSENLIPQEVKRNPSSDGVSKQIPLSNQLTVSGNNENKKVRRKSITNGTSLERVKSPGNKKKSTDIEDSDEYPSESESIDNGFANSDDDLNEILDTSAIKPASEKRNKEFHQIFKRIPPNEKLIDEFGCALSKDILVQGRMYLSEHYICFNSNILGWVTNIIIPLQEVIQIEKKSTAVLFPNGMIIRTLYHKYVFATFLSRDSTFALITNVWHGVLLGNSVESNSILDKKRNDKNYSSESTANDEDLFPNGSNSRNGEDDDGGDDEEDAEGSSIVVSHSEASSLDNFLANRTDGDDIKVVKSRSSNGNNIGQGDSKSSDSFHGLPVVGPLTHSQTDIDYSKGSDETFISDDVVKAPLGVVFLILFGPDNSNFIKILKDQKNYDISDEDITELSTESKERNYTYTKPLNGPIGPKKTKCVIKDKLVEFDTDKYILVEQVTTTPDVPSGNSFQVKTKIFLSWAENNCTRIYSLTVVEWSGRSWIKGAVEKGSIDGQKESMKSMVDSINLIIRSGGTSGVGKLDKKKRKRKKSEATNKPVVEAIPEPEKSTLEKLQLFVEAIGKTISIPYVGDLVSGIIILFIGLLFFTEVYNYLFHHKSKDPFNVSNLQIISQDSVVSKIKINDDKYFVIPSVESHFHNKKSKLQNEVAIWKWVNDRSNGALNIFSQEESENNQQYSNQEIKEIVRIVQSRLDEVKNRMGSEHI
ncbi:uncharacterized protein AC631_04266 [Debaryomyces fabryi]|uniref:VASt domain-containing protein n=1 Tax=Debaryomyces fabryi TaxID=58627 RepID=A0A0V1PUV9_9ASCO|nr:uncharacterized protein AC631_04266 [Debaryomyces fabryi]KRZ99970.1 hypothetical protein AC631_04266 [Debaryomyces fabryi]CUM53245.1 unnamed protein product [Debaryomyces fabryi]